MEMNDPIIMQILNTQTQMLQQMQMNSQTPNTSSVGAQNGGSFAMYAPPPNAFSAQAPVAPAGATAFPMYTPPVDVGAPHSLARSYVSPTAGAITQLFNNYTNYDPTRQSVESQADFIARQNRIVQEGMMRTSEVLPGLLSLGGLLTPGGLIAGAATGMLVGGTIKTFNDQARLAFNYEDTLRRGAYTFLNPFESTAESGAIGFSRSENQDLARYLRHLGPEKFLDDKDIQSVLTGAMDHKLLRSVTDVDSFKKKFSEIIDTVKHITVSLDQSIDEAMKFMGELQARGVATNQMGFVAAQAKVTSSMLGVNTSIGSQAILQTVDSVTQGTAMNATNVMQTASTNLALAQMVQDQSRTSDPTLYNYIKNNGGAMQMGANSEQFFRNFYSSQDGANRLLAFFGSAFDQTANGFTLNEGRMQDLMSGKYSPNDLQALTTQTLSGLNGPQKDLLARSAPTMFQDFAKGTNEFALLGSLAQQLMRSQGLSAGQAVQQLTGADTNMANFLAQQINFGTDRDVMNSLNGRTVGQELNSVSIAETPTIFQRMRYGYSSLMRNTVGDFGQSVYDSSSDALYGLQQWMVHGKDRRVTGGRAFDFSAGTLTEELGFSGGIDSEAGIGYYAKETLTEGKYNVLLDQARTGQLDPQSVSALISRRDSGNANSVERNRIDRILTAATGKQQRANAPTFLGMSPFAMDTASRLTDLVSNIGLGDVVNFLTPLISSPAETNILPNMPNDITSVAVKKLEKNRKEYLSEQEGLSRELNQLFADNHGDSAFSNNIKGLTDAIRSGDVNQVRKFTPDGKAAELAGKYRSLHDRNKDNDDKSKELQTKLSASEALARSVDTTKQLFTLSGVLTPQGAADYFASSEQASRRILNGLEQGTLSYSEMLKLDQQLYKSMNTSLEFFSNNDLRKLLDTVMARSGGMLGSKESFLDANDQVNPVALINAISRMSANVQSDGSAASGKMGASGMLGKETDKVMKDHETAMNKMLTSVQNEIGMLTDFTQGKKIRSPKTNLATGG